MQRVQEQERSATTRPSTRKPGFPKTGDSVREAYGLKYVQARPLARSQSVKVYEGANIRNVVLVGHGHAGKTSLVSAMLYTAGAQPASGPRRRWQRYHRLRRRRNCPQNVYRHRPRLRRVGQDQDQLPRYSRLQHVRARGQVWPCRLWSRRWSWWTASPASKSSPSGFGVTATKSACPA